MIDDFEPVNTNEKERGVILIPEIVE